MPLTRIAVALVEAKKLFEMEATMENNNAENNFAMDADVAKVDKSLDMSSKNRIELPVWWVVYVIARRIWQW